MRGWAAVVVAPALLIGGCGTQTAPAAGGLSIYRPTSGTVTGVYANMSGTLSVSGGCLGLKSASGDFQPIVVLGKSYRSDGTALIHDTQRMKVGDEVILQAGGLGAAMRSEVDWAPGCESFPHAILVTPGR